MSGERSDREFYWKRSGAKLALAAVLTTGLLGMATSPLLQAQATESAGRSDADIQGDVNYALTNSKSLKNQQITAATVEGSVTLSGNVRDEASKELAESVISRISGVTTITNNLTVGAAAATEAAAPTAAGNQQQDPNYDPASQNMAPADQNAAAPSPQQPPDPSQAQQTMPGQGADVQSQGQYPAPGNQGYPAQQPGYSANAAMPSGPVTVPSGTLLQIRTSEPLDSGRAQPGQIFQATVAADVYEGSVLALPRGAVITGTVLSTSTNRGDLAGRQGFSLGLTSINLAGQSYPLPTDAWSGRGPGKGGYSAANTIGGAGVGAVIGGIAGGGAGAAIGAGVGGLVGAGASAATNGPRMFIPAEAVLNFHLTAPITVNPVSPQEAQRLATNSVPRQPQLRPRYGYPYGYPPPPPAYYYGYRYPVAYPRYYYPY